jgi:hypothetical protein
MIKRQLNPLRIGKGLLCLLALFMMLLAPQGAWAEDYALTIAGQQYTDEQLGSTITLTSAQSTDITGGSITITRASNSDPVKLTFDNVTLSSNIVSNIDLEVYLIGGSKISYSPSVNNPDPCFKGNNNSLIFTTSETNPGTLFISKTSSMDDFASGWGGDSTTPIWDEDCDNEPNGYYWWVDQSCGYMYLKVNKKYDLEMNGSQVCDAMFKKLFPYADFPSIYMSDAQTLVVNGDYEYPITSNMSALTVAVAGKVTLSSIRFASKGSVTSGTLTISKYTNSSSNEVSLTLNNTNDNDPTIYGFSSVTIANPMSLKTPNTVPDNWNSYFDEVFISNYVSYGITVGGEEVTDKNAENIFNDVNPSAVFDNTTNTLTFNNIDINQIWNYAPFIVNGRGNLTIHIVGTQNNIKCSSKFIAKSSASASASDYTVTFTTDENNGGKLTYTTNTSEFCSGHKFIFNNGLGWKISGPDSDSRYNMTIDQTGYNYNLSVAGVEVTSSNASSITGDYITGNGTVSYDPVTNTLTLDNATIDLSSYPGPGIKYTGTENFTIKLIGTNSVKVANNCEPIIYDPVVAPTPIPTLTFESGSFPCSLSLQGVNSSVIKYFGDVLGVNGINSAEGNYLTISNSEVEVKYDPANSTNGLYTGDNTAVTSVTISSVSLESVAPTINRMAMQDADGIKLILSSGINNGTIKYSVNYVDPTETNITDATYDDTNRPTISKPATVTAYISVNNETSATATAKYFGFTEPMKVVYEGTPVELKNLPTLVPATQGLSYEIGKSLNEDVISLYAETGKYRAEGYGTAVLIVNIPEDVYPLNDGCETTLTVNVVPPAPTIGLDEGEVLNTATITLTTTIDGATIKYKWDDGTEETYSEAIPVQAGTLKAWVEVSSVVSDVVEATYSLITDISTLYFAAIDDIPYTGSAVTPAIVVKETKDAETPLTLGTDYTISYKQGETSITAANLVNRGDYTVVISGTGNYGGTKELNFSITTGIATITAENQTAEYTGDQIEFDKNAITLTPNTLSKDGLSFNYYTPNPDNPEEPNMLEVAPTNVGTYIVEISFEDDNYAAEPVTKTLTISAKSITSDMITLSESSFEYNGKKQVPTVTVKDGEVTLVGDDYDVSFELVIEDEDPIAIEDENAIIDVATYNVVVTGKGNYTSSATKAFAITKASLPVGGENGLKVTLAGWKYGAEANTPSVSGNLGNGDVTYTYKDAEDENAEFSTTVPTNVGSYIVKATVAESDNYYGGTATNEFSIEKGDLTMVSASVPEELIYDGTEKQLITVANVPEGATAKYYWSAITENEFKNGDYDLVCDPEDNIFTNPVPKATNAGYYAIIYKVFGGDNYNDKLASQTMKVAIYPATITELTINPTSMAYTGAAQTVTITSVKAGDLVLTANDYTVTLNDVALTGNIQATAVGEYTVTVTGQGNFTGTESATFSIVNRTLADNEVTFYNNWATYYSAVGDVMLPEGIGAFIVLESGIGENTVTVTPINYVPENVAVLLSNDDKVVTQTDNTSAAGNMLRHADEDVDADAFEGLIYGLHNGKLMRVTGTIPAGKNYLVAWEAQAPQLTIVFEGETTGVNDVRSKTAETGADFYDMQGRKVQKPSKKGLYISNGRKVVVK